MAEAVVDGVIRRKIAATKAMLAEGAPGADRAWRLALARAARDNLQMPLEVLSVKQARRSLTELLELPPQHALLALLQGPSDGIGLLVLSQPVLAAMIEAQTLGKVGSAALVSRKPTRTDAAMVAETLDAALQELEVTLAQEVDLVWAGGFRYASFLEDPRPLALLLDDVEYRVLTAEVSLGLGARTGEILLILPADGRGELPVTVAAVDAPDVQNGAAFADALAAQVEDAGCVLDAVLARVSLPLTRVMALRVGEIVTLPRARIDQISFEGLDGRALAEGKLGQNRGMRAIRLSPDSPQTPGKLHGTPAAMVLSQAVVAVSDHPTHDLPGEADAPLRQTA